MSDTASSPYTAPSADTDLVTNSAADTYEPKVFALKGRIGRLRYLAYSWLYGFILVCAWFPLVLLFGISILGFGSLNPDLGVILGLLVVAAAYIISISAFAILAIRRLHDLNKTGWLLLVFFIPFINMIFALYLIFAPGTKGTNDYGFQPSQNHPILWAPVVLWVLFIVGGSILAITLDDRNRTYNPSVQLNQ